MTAFPAAGDVQNAANTVPDQKAIFEAWLAATKQLPGAAAETELTIAAGAITPTGFVHRVDTEADAAADNLDNILQTNLPDGALLLLAPENAARVATLRHQVGGAGEMVLNNGENFALDHANKRILLRRKGTQWIEEERWTLFGRRVAGTADAAALRTLAALGTAATQNTGTSGANVPLLNGANTHSGATSIAALLDIQQDHRLSGVISPAQLTANTDNWNPASLSTASVIRFSTDASRNITGLAGGASGRCILLVNTGSQDAVLVHDATSTAANRFYCPNAANYTLKGKASVGLWYDNTASRWMVVDNVISQASAFSAYAESGQLSLTLGATVSFTHGLGATAKAVDCYLECVSAEGGYSVGDYARAQGAYSGTVGIWPLIDGATTVKAQIGNTSLQVSTKGAGANLNITLASWRARLRCWA